MTRVGLVAGLAFRGRRRAPMELADTLEMTTDAGISGDHKGARFPNRQVTILSLEDWQAALADLAEYEAASRLALDDAPLDSPWTTRRANVLIAGVDLPKIRGAMLALGDVRLEITGPCVPCARMDEARPGLLKALARHNRGGATAKVITGGPLTVGDPVSVLGCPVVRARVLPG